MNYYNACNVIKIAALVRIREPANYVNHIITWTPRILYVYHVENTVFSALINSHAKIVHLDIILSLTGDVQMMDV